MFTINVVLIELILQECPHLGEFLVTLCLQRLDEVCELPILLLGDAKFVAHLES
jgi:hypothetical protein